MNDLTPINNQLPAELDNLTAQDVGRGVSTKPEDQLFPLIYVLQSNSPVCEKRRSEYIEGAEPGHFWLRGAVNPIRSGVDGLNVIPCGMVRCFLEWMPNRGGYVGRHEQRPDDAEPTIITDGGRDKELLVRANGHIIQDTREFFLLVDGQAYALGCYGTKHTFARQWQTYFNQFKHPRTGGLMPSFSRRYRLTTAPAGNDLGKWFGLKFHDLGWLTDKDEYAAARAINDVVEQGRAQGEAPRE
jgi:hypothetical protein